MRFIDPTGAVHHPAWFDPHPLAADHAVIPRMLQSWAAANAQAPCVQFDDDTLWSYGEAWAMARRTAGGFRAIGVEQGDIVLVWLPNGPSFMRAWFGLSTLGAVHTPLNVALRGKMLEHVIRNSGAKTMIAHKDLVSRLEGLDLSQLDCVIVCGGTDPAGGDIQYLSEDALSKAEPADRLTELQPWDLAAVLYTSGTTGLSKGVMIPYAQLATAGQVAHGYLKRDDRIYIFTPLFHTVGISAVFATLNKGACLHLAESFRGPTFWQDVKRTGCNRILGLISSMTSYLAKAVPAGEPCPFDFAMMSPITAETVKFAKDQGFGYFSAYSMTELSVPVLSDVNSGVLGSCGRPRSGVECRVVDANDIEVPQGGVGELIVRTDWPWTNNVGYLNDPIATANAWRNGWFHTGDAFRQDEEGNFYFVDRLKDSIRRRGENISSVEVELEVASYPGVMEAAVIGVPSAYGDEEVMVVLAPLPGHTVDPAQLTAFLLQRLAHFMVPRYVRIVDALPKTPTNKIKKHELRETGLPQGTWDREAHGIYVKRQKLA
ncbi:AMP-binding protein [Microbacteriaceae bacterium K1510]|nr:AMP-binding protein [Microbacteriaceae bacterium K1510]